MDCTGPQNKGWSPVGKYKYKYISSIALTNSNGQKKPAHGGGIPRIGREYAPFTGQRMALETWVQPGWRPAFGLFIRFADNSAASR